MHAQYRVADFDPLLGGGFDLCIVDPQLGGWLSVSANTKTKTTQLVASQSSVENSPQQRRDLASVSGCVKGQGRQTWPRVSEHSTQHISFHYLQSLRELPGTGEGRTAAGRANEGGKRHLYHSVRVKFSKNHNRGGRRCGQPLDPRHLPWTPRNARKSRPMKSRPFSQYMMMTTKVRLQKRGASRSWLIPSLRVVWQPRDQQRTTQVHSENCPKPRRRGRKSWWDSSLDFWHRID